MSTLVEALGIRDVGEKVAVLELGGVVLTLEVKCIWGESWDCIVFILCDLM